MCLPCSAACILCLFHFSPLLLSLRKKSFLWADDLSSYDSILDLGFSIPFYGDHVSLFPILASIAIFFYTKMTTGQQRMPQQPGMPNMKIIMYLMPLMMLFFFNNYASGLSLYYFVSNLLTIFLDVDHKELHYRRIRRSTPRLRRIKRSLKKQEAFQRVCKRRWKKLKSTKKASGG